ncbi:helix-turn-helix domain-containing protein [Bifidobacterium mongoliense]|uniref:helix-turn-helix domain-containing protein n=1 Tax=Bifidobacterium mongoliense TaxID=518643 RepID=UPI003BEEC547
MVLRRSFSNHSKALGALISRTLRGSRPLAARRRPTVRTDVRGPVAKNSSQSQTRLSFPNRAKVVADYERGDAVKDIAARYGIHRATVTEILRRAEVPARRYGLAEQIREEAAHLYTQGMGIRDVAKRLGISYDGARAGIVAYGAVLRPPGCQPQH